MFETPIEIKNLQKHYGQHLVLNNLSLQVKRGESFALNGSNGSGKTTLLRVLATLTTCSGGSVRVCGRDVTTGELEVRRLVGFVGHETYLYPTLSGMENLLFYARLYQVEQAKKRVQELLEAFGLSSRSSDPVHLLSRGMCQRMTIARALLHRPPVLLLDEPYTGLDGDFQTMLNLFLTEYCRQGGTLLWATHLPANEALPGTRRGELINGRIVQHHNKDSLSCAKREAVRRGA